MGSLEKLGHKESKTCGMSFVKHKMIESELNDQNIDLLDAISNTM